ncbi:uncharacterized protein MONBRDRAFT_29122 [Monosiga brevicollis MX1]|uniref:Uncharacterized protein n=1 Tax=Monosiga brevicollis TaxID=81824 RepID=A9VA68_MONBE|nr:uncharacterized protein MONBRDRAFT_29122 [Monosiga brevicollis MX1]EDQ85676.1 predicted protein [Monosiga brevicollis MX1]|eukprot:XP_001749625.1 hypothetical protein [Monosiga brevicollis MX1]
MAAKIRLSKNAVLHLHRHGLQQTDPFEPAYVQVMSIYQAFVDAATVSLDPAYQGQNTVYEFRRPEAKVDSLQTGLLAPCVPASTSWLNAPPIVLLGEVVRVRRFPREIHQSGVRALRPVEHQRKCVAPPAACAGLCLPFSPATPVIPALHARLDRHTALASHCQLRLLANLDSIDMAASGFELNREALIYPEPTVPHTDAASTPGATDPLRQQLLDTRVFLGQAINDLKGLGQQKGCLIVTLLRKSPIYCHARADTTQKYPVRAYLEVRDHVGGPKAVIVLWTRAVHLFYECLEVGDVLVIENYNLRRPTMFLPIFSNAELEISANSSHLETRIRILSPAQVTRIQPNVPSLGQELCLRPRIVAPACENGSGTSIAGIVTHVGRLRRTTIRHRACLQRWIKVVDFSQGDRPWLVALDCAANAELFFDLSPGMAVLIMDLKLQWILPAPDVLSYNVCREPFLFSTDRTRMCALLDAEYEARFPQIAALVDTVHGLVPILKHVAEHREEVKRHGLVGGWLPYRYLIEELGWQDSLDWAKDLTPMATLFEASVCMR